jgi:hypothetical protein
MPTLTSRTRLLKTSLRLNYLSWPRSRSHWSATGPKIQQPPNQLDPTTTEPTWDHSVPSNSSRYWPQQSDQSVPDLPDWAAGTPDTYHRHTGSPWTLSRVRPVKAMKTPNPQTDLPSSKTDQIRNINNRRDWELIRTLTRAKPTRAQHWLDRSQAPARPVKPRHLGMNSNPQVNSPKSQSRSPDLLHGFAQDFGDVETPHGNSIYNQ